MDVRKNAAASGSVVLLLAMPAAALARAMTATIDEPHVALSADADFKDYNFSAQPNSGATSR